MCQACAEAQHPDVQPLLARLHDIHAGVPPIAVVIRGDIRRSTTCTMSGIDECHAAVQPRQIEIAVCIPPAGQPFRSRCPDCLARTYPVADAAIRAHLGMAPHAPPAPKTPAPPTPEELAAQQRAAYVTAVATALQEATSRPVVAAKRLLDVIEGLVRAGGTREE